MAAQTSAEHDSAATEKTQRRYDRQAFSYDAMDVPFEVLAFRRLRKKLWADVAGRTVLEVGVGTGKNLAYHPEDTQIVAVDLSPRMLRRAIARAERTARIISFVLADVQHLPFHEGAFDAAVATFVFCSVPNPVAGLEEVRRTVRREASVHLLEHVRAANPLAGKLMDWSNPVGVRLTGANINRNTVANVSTAGIEIDGVETYGLGLLKLVRGTVPQRPRPTEAGTREAAPPGPTTT